MLGFHKAHPGEIGLNVFADLPKDAWELARFWVTSEKSFVSVARRENWTPELLGSLLIECVQNAAASYASSGSMSENEALERIWLGIDRERARLSPQEQN
jgi:hypothetical protein